MIKIFKEHTHTHTHIYIYIYIYIYIIDFLLLKQVRTALSHTGPGQSIKKWTKLGYTDLSSEVYMWAGRTIGQMKNRQDFVKKKCLFYHQKSLYALLPSGKEKYIK